MDTTQTPLPERSRDEAAEPSGSARPTGFLAFALLLALCFGQPLLFLAKYAVNSDLHSHIVLVPFVSAYLLFIQRRRLAKEYLSSGWALIPLFVGLTALFLAWGQPAESNWGHGDSLSLLTFSFVSLLTAGGFLFLGRKWMATAAFPFAFLIFMLPLPGAVVEFLETASKLASAEAAALFFNLTGTPVLRDGNVFHLPGISLEVAQECSGIRSSWVLFITSVLASYLFLKSPWRRAILISLVIPVAIVRNGFRILVIGLLCVQLGPQMINSVIHHRGGPLFFALSLIPLFLLLWWLRRGEQKKS
jgi:exosortase C (VPDSG-CTERM-specific)